MVVMLVMGVIGGMLWGLIPAFLKVRFNANEILTSLMLVYVAGLIFDWLVRGRLRDPQGFNFPKTVEFRRVGRHCRAGATFILARSLR